MNDLPSTFDIKFAIIQLLAHTADVTKAQEFYDWLMQEVEVETKDNPLVNTEGSVVQLDLFNK